MGRIDSDLMYDIATNWYWGNSGSPDIYHDPQTRIQGLSYRSNLARLVEQLLEENKIEKAKDIIDLAMKNIPVEYFEYYTFVEPFVDGYYKVGETNKAHELFEKLKYIYQDRLEYYAEVPLEEQYDKIDEIIPISTDDAKKRCKQLALDNGLLVGISSGANILASERWVEKNNPDGIVFTILCDRGERYTSILD